MHRPTPSRHPSALLSLAVLALGLVACGGPATGTVPTVKSTSPLAGAIGVARNAAVSATFDQPMAALSSTSLVLKQGTTAIAGAVTMSADAKTAIFTPASTLSASTEYTATLTTAATSTGGKGLSAAHSWSFTTGTTSRLGPTAVNLGTAGNFAVLAKTGVSTVPGSAITGDIGLGPAAATYLTGFSLVADSSNVFSTSPQVTGQVFAADYAVPTPTNLTAAVSDMETAYTDAAGRPTPDFLELGSGNLGGRTLTPGLYSWTSSVTIPSGVVLSGGANDVWILQTTGDLTVAAAQQVTLSGGALAKNVFWQVAGRVTLGATSHFEGIVLCKTDVTLETGASLNGRVLSQTQVALQQATLTVPAP